MPPKRLKHNPKLLFLSHYNYVGSYEELDGSDIVENFYRSLTISQSFLDSFFHDPDFHYTELLMNESSFVLDRCCNYKWQERYLSCEGVIALMELSNFTKICLCFNVHSLDERFVKSCANFCKVLKKSQTLKTIDLSMNNEGTYRPKWASLVLADLLPKNKIGLLRCRSDNAILFNMHSIQTLEITDYKASYTIYQKIEKALLFKMKVKRLNFDCMRTFGLFEIPRLKPLRPNPILEELILTLRFIIFTNEYYRCKGEWIKEYLPQFKDAFECLSVVGPQIKIELIGEGGHMYVVNDFDGIESMIENARWCLKMAVDCALEAGIKIESFQLKWDPEIVSPDFFQNYPHASAKRLKLAVGGKYKKSLVCTENYKGTELKFEIGFRNENDYRNPDPLFMSKRPELNYNAYREWL